MMELIQDNLIQILATIITAVASFIGVSIKKAYTKYVDTKTKKEIVDLTVKYIEQIYKGIMISNEDKLSKAKEKALEWLNSKGLKISDTELDILIESAVNGLKKTNEVK
nr:MAG TPA: holin [Caudoviricetes sp.]